MALIFSVIQGNSFSRGSNRSYAIASSKNIFCEKVLDRIALDTLYKTIRAWRRSRNVSR